MIDRWPFLVVYLAGACGFLVGMVMWRVALALMVAHAMMGK